MYGLDDDDDDDDGQRYGYDTQQVCDNGHQVTDSLRRNPDVAQDHCSDCGAKTIHQCPQCSTEIRGHLYSRRVARLYNADVPSNCHKCGAAFPWTAKKLQATSSDRAAVAPDALALLRKVLVRFHLLVRQLRERHAGRATLDVSDEYDVQDLIHALLKAFFDDVRAEETVPSYAGKSARMDFLLKSESIGVEVKMTRPGLGEKEVGSQLIEDIHRYSAHQNCKRLLCFVYDPAGRLSNPRGLETDLSRKEGEIAVEVIVVPRGY